MRWHKYHAIPTEIDGIRFPSKKEARYYQDLLLARRSGDLQFFVRQVSFYLPGGVRYDCDFAELRRNGEVCFVDCKGFRTPVYKVKKKIVEAMYKIKILEV